MRVLPRFIQVQPNEYLVVGRRGRLRSLGMGASAVLGPRSTWAAVPGGKQEACFQMTQESQDGIPLRFKGIALYRVVDPVAAAMAFDFRDGTGLTRIAETVAHVCLGELRDLVSHLPLKACIEERKTTLTDAVAAALRRVVEGEEGSGGAWGIALDLLQVAQVFIVDDDLRQRLEAEVRHEILAGSEKSALAMKEDLERTRLASARRIAAETLEHDREANRTGRERVRLEHDLALERLQGEAALATARDQARLKAEEETALARHASRRRTAEAELAEARALRETEQERLSLQAALEQERATREAETRRHRLGIDRDLAALVLEAARAARDVKAVEAETEVLEDRARQELEERILPLRQVPRIARALSEALQGADLSVYGADQVLAATLGPLVERLGRSLGVDRPASKGGAA